MDDPFSIPPEGLSGAPEEQSSPAENEPARDLPPAASSDAAVPLPAAASEPAAEPIAIVKFEPAPQPWPAYSAPLFPLPERASRRNFLHNLYLLLGVALAAFTLTAWILVRVPSPLDLFSTGPQQIVQAQLRALDHGELRAAYDMFSQRYRAQVPFNEWHDLIVTHWRIFHAEVLSAGAVAQSGSRATLEIHLRGADDRAYRARFTLIRIAGRWWVDDVHWTDEEDEGSTFRT